MPGHLWSSTYSYLKGKKLRLFYFSRSYWPTSCPEPQSLLLFWDPELRVSSVAELEGEAARPRSWGGKVCGQAQSLSVLLSFVKVSGPQPCRSATPTLVRGSRQQSSELQNDLNGIEGEREVTIEREVKRGEMLGKLEQGSFADGSWGSSCHSKSQLWQREGLSALAVRYLSFLVSNSPAWLIRGPIPVTLLKVCWHP